MKNLIILFLVIPFFFLHTSYAQRRGHDARDGIQGKILELNSQSPIEYANIVIRSSHDSTVITGTVSGKDGRFTITGVPNGRYIVDIRFIGFKDKKLAIEITPEQSAVQLGDIMIEPDPLRLKEMVVEGDRSPVSYQIDKKVVDVGKIQTAVSGTAADVMQNVPSVTVDIDGNVSLRGSTNFTVLVDGRPSIMDTQDILQQIPASSIDKIEIITNPSAKYDPEGTAGIVNILMKKDQTHGFSGILNLNMGLKDKYGTDGIVQHKGEYLTTYLGIDWNKRYMPGTSNSINRYYSALDTSNLTSDGTNNFERKGYGIRGALEYELVEQGVLNVGGRYGKRDGIQYSNLNYREWSTLNPTVTQYRNRGEGLRSGEFSECNVTYTQEFGEKGHELKGEFNYGYDKSEEGSLTEEISNNEIISGLKTSTTDRSHEIESRIDYSRPLGEKTKFEAGYEGQSERSEESDHRSIYDPATGYTLQPQFSTVANYRTSDHSLYSLYADEIGNFGYQAGLRTEYTFRVITLSNQTGEFSLDRWDLFPTLHTSYKLGEVTQSMASYTRRIRRPHGWELEPFLTWTDANNVRRGNPDLKPQYIDSYDAGVQTLIGSVSVSADFYYRIIHDKVERIRSLYPDTQNVTLTTVQNVGIDKSLGTECMVIFDLFPFWNVNLMANLYDYRVEGVLPSGPFSRSSFNWSSRWNNVFKINGSTQVQLNLHYNSPTISTQGKVKEHFTVDLAAKREFFNKVLSATLQIRDLFGTMKMENIAEGSDFYALSSMKRESPMVMLNLRLNFNNYENEREERNDQNGNNEEL